MNEKKRFRLAAAAIGCTVEFEDAEEGGWVPWLYGYTPGDDRGEWNPLSDRDDSEKLRLALRIELRDHPGEIEARYRIGNETCSCRVAVPRPDKEAEASMEAIFQAAVAMGQAKST